MERIILLMIIKINIKEIILFCLLWIKSRAKVKIKVEDIQLRESGNISFQIRFSEREPITIKYVGFNGNAEIFEKNATYVP